MKKLAVIDLGSNSIRMSIFAIDGETVKTLEAYRSVIGLSRGMNVDMCLRQDAQMRAVDAVLEYKKILGEQNVEKVIFVATAAVRKAKNQREFLALMKEKTDFDIIVATGHQEAALDALAVKEALGIDKGIICDIGGGSTELIEVGSHNKISIPYGCRSITEMFFDQENAESLSRAEEFLDGEFRAVEWLDALKGESIVGIGGTLRAAARFDMGDDAPKNIENYRISPERMGEIMDVIINATPEEREKIPAIGKDRADIILAGAVFVKSLIKAIRPREFVVADVGVREGAAIDFVQNCGII